MQSSNYREAISRIRTEFKIQSADTLVNCPDRMILSEIQSTTILFITQRTDKRALWNSPNIFTLIPCLKLEQVPLAECCDYVSDCTIARSCIQLPKIAEGTNFGMLIQGLYSIDGISRRFIESTPDRYRNALDMKLTTKQVHFWLQNKYLYIGDDRIERVKLSAYFTEDIPDTLIQYPTNCTQILLTGCCPASGQTDLISTIVDCCPPNPYDALWPIPSKLEDLVIKEVANKLLNTYKRSIPDENKLPGKDSSK